MKKEHWESLAKYLLTSIIGCGGTAIYFHILINRELGEHKTQINSIEKTIDELKLSIKGHDEFIHKLDKDVNGLDLKYGNIELSNKSIIKNVSPNGPTTTINLKNELIRK